MTAFTAGSTISISLDEYDITTISGLADLVITVGTRHSFETRNVGTLTYGPFGAVTTISLKGIVDGTYTTATSKQTNPVKIVDLSTAEISAPTAAQLAATDTLYQLNAAPYTLYQSNGTSLVPLGGGGTWGSISGALSSQTDLQSALNAKATYNAPVTLSANTSLTSAAHANRTILVDTAGLTLTINNDATGGWVAGDSLYIVPIGSGTFSLVQGTATLNTPAGTSAASSTAIGGVVGADRIGADTWMTTSTSSSVTSGSNTVRSYKLAANPTVIAAGAGTNQQSAKITVPANVLGINGWGILRGIFIKNGTTDTISMSVKANSVGGAYSAGTSLNSWNIGAANYYLIFELLFSGNRSDATSIKCYRPAGGGIPYATNVAAGSALVTATVTTSSSWELQFGGNAGANDSFQLVDAQVIISNPDA